ncbi:neurotensin/neuromedin N [Engraulis encrasicolus]|uniref:neurotensin/neuromedin N n=1 Tax=Engraulis encrasicolus TaxID=184585 RepID=UPI002FD71942
MEVTSVTILADAEQDTRTIEEELLSNFFTSKLKQSKHSTILWRLTLLQVCGLLDGLEGAWQPESDGPIEDEDEDYRPRLPPLSSQSAEDVYTLQSLCRVLKPREVSDVEEYLSSDALLKRKSPYILKRQAAYSSNKQPRRPYILKRSPILY